MDLRDEVLDALLDLWFAQDETLRLAEQWSRYEAAIDDAALAAAEKIRKARTVESGSQAARRIVASRSRGLSKDQQRQAFRKAVNIHLASRDGTSASSHSFRSVFQRRRDLGLLSSQLVTLVADFELFVLRIMTAWLDFDPSHLSERRRDFSLEQLQHAGSIDELRESIIQGFLEEHMRESASKWFSVFASMFGGSIEGAEDYETVEAFQRRHIIVHHSGLVSRQYLQQLKRFKHAAKLGDHLSVDLSYIQSSADALAMSAHSIALSAMYASTKGNDSEISDVEQEVGELTYVLLEQHRDRVVDRFANTFDTARVKKQWPREQIKVNGWIAKRRLGLLDEVRTDIEGWDVSAVEPRFTLARHVLLEETEEVIGLVKELLREGRMSLLQIEYWPLFEGMRAEILAAVSEDSAPGGEQNPAASG